MDARLEEAQTPVWKWSWPAVLIGTVVAVASMALLAWIGAALLALPILNPYLVAAEDGSAWLLFRTLGWIALLAVVPLGLGAWLAGRWAESGRKVAVLHGLTVWALALLVTAVGYLAVTQLTTLREKADFSVFNELSQSFDALKEKQFAAFLTTLARAWKPGEKEDSAYVSAKIDNRANPDAVPEETTLQAFVMAHASLTRAQAIQFLNDYKNTIAIEEVQARLRFEQAHRTLWARQQRARSIENTIDWTLALAFSLTVAAALVGAREGWRSRGEPARRTSGF